MNQNNILELLKQVESGQINADHAYSTLKNLPYKDIGFAKIDNHRALRVGYPEVIYGESKTKEQVLEIMEYMIENNKSILATRVSKEMGEYVQSKYPEIHHNPLGRTLSLDQRDETIESDDFIAIVSGGTSDLYVVEEAYETAKIFGNRVKKFTDVGVAGIHRLFGSLEEILEAKVIIVVAGMEGALASVLGGLVSQPIIAVPTSVGYGAHFNGVASLLSMLNSCASGVTVVNIDNGFGAAYAASQINKL